MVEPVRSAQDLEDEIEDIFDLDRFRRINDTPGHSVGALLRLSQALTRVADTGSVLDEALGAFPTLMQAGRVAAWIQDAQTGVFELIRDTGSGSAADPRLDGHAGPAYEDMPDVLVLPLRWEPEGVGAFVVEGRDVGVSFSQHELDLAHGIADITSLALGNARRFDELERAYVSTVEVLANALEAQDAYTESHCRALADLAVVVGGFCGIAGDRLRHLELAGVFHDIGKIGIPSEIIRKAGPLKAAERRLMEKHTVIGARILEPVPFLHPVIPIVRSSHERWDGQGYPDGLEGEDIPLESRIVFVCDAFHAMTTDRPYRAALPEREAIRRLKLSSGTQFDPKVVEAFVAAHEAGRICVDQSHRGGPAGGR